MAGVPFRFLDTGRRPENGLARSLLQAHSADGAFLTRPQASTLYTGQLS
jgi:hypothetical protein